MRSQCTAIHIYIIYINPMRIVHMDYTKPYTHEAHK